MRSPLHLLQWCAQRCKGAAWEIINPEDRALLSNGEGASLLMHHLKILVPGLYYLHIPTAFEYEEFEIMEARSKSLSKLKGIADLGDPQATIRWVLDSYECAKPETELSEILYDLIAELHRTVMEEMSRYGVFGESSLEQRP